MTAVPERRKGSRAARRRSAGGDALARLAIEQAVHELVVLAELIEDKAGLLTSQIQLLTTLQRPGERRPPGPSREAAPQRRARPERDAYAPTSEDMGRLVRDMQYHDEACQRIAGIVMMLEGAREAIDAEDEDVSQPDPDLALALIERCELGDMRRALRKALAARSSDPRFREEMVDDPADEDESVTLF